MVRAVRRRLWRRLVASPGAASQMAMSGVTASHTTSCRAPSADAARRRVPSAAAHNCSSADGEASMRTRSRHRVAALCGVLGRERAVREQPSKLALPVLQAERLAALEALELAHELRALLLLDGMLLIRRASACCSDEKLVDMSSASRRKSRPPPQASSACARRGGDGAARRRAAPPPRDRVGGRRLDTSAPRRVSSRLLLLRPLAFKARGAARQCWLPIVVVVRRGGTDDVVGAGVDATTGMRPPSLVTTWQPPHARSTPGGRWRALWRLQRILNALLEEHAACRTPSRARSPTAARAPRRPHRSGRRSSCRSTAGEEARGWAGGHQLLRLVPPRRGEERLLAVLQGLAAHQLLGTDGPRRHQVLVHAGAKGAAAAAAAACRRRCRRCRHRQGASLDRSAGASGRRTTRRVRARPPHRHRWGCACARPWRSRRRCWCAYAAPMTHRPGRRRLVAAPRARPSRHCRRTSRRPTRCANAPGAGPTGRQLQRERVRALRQTLIEEADRQLRGGGCPRRRRRGQGSRCCCCRRRHPRRADPRRESGDAAARAAAAAAAAAALSCDSLSRHHLTYNLALLTKGQLDAGARRVKVDGRHEGAANLGDRLDRRRRRTLPCMGRARLRVSYGSNRVRQDGFQGGHAPLTR